jgi:uncharacterized protein
MLTGHLPTKLDHRRLAIQGASLNGLIPLSGFSRLVGLLENTTGNVQVGLMFHTGDGRQTCVDGQVNVEVSLICQNCMTEYLQPLACKVHSEIVAVDKPLDEENQRDQLIYADKLIPAVELVEDDLILAIPMIPRHDGPCTEGEYIQSGDNTDEVVTTVETHRPFADLAKVINDQSKVES